MTNIKSKTTQKSNQLLPLQNNFQKQESAALRPKTSIHYKTNHKPNIFFFEHHNPQSSYKEANKKNQAESQTQVIKSQRNSPDQMNDKYNEKQYLLNRKTKVKQIESVNGNFKQKELDQSKLNSKIQIMNYPDQPIFINRKTKQYKNPEKSFIQQRRKSNLRHKIKKQQQHYLKHPIHYNKVDMVNQLQKPLNSCKSVNQSIKTKMIDHLTNQIRNKSINNINKLNLSKKSMKQKSGSQFLKSNQRSNISNEKIDLQNEEFLENVTPEQRLNYILDVISDSKLNNILWNDASVQQILESLNIYNQKQLDEYLENNTQYFQSIFRSSPFGNFNLHYMRPSITSYNSQFQYQNSNSKSFNDMPILKMNHYESLSKLHLQKGKFKSNPTNYLSEFTQKKSFTKQSVVPDTYKIGQPMIIMKTTNQFQLPNRLDYQSRIFKRLQQKNVVVGSQFAGNSQYQKKYQRNQGIKNSQFSSQLTKQLLQPKKSLYTKNIPVFESSYSHDYQNRNAKYTPPQFKYHTQLQKATNQQLPLEAYETTKKMDSKILIENGGKNIRKYIVPWKHKILSKLKALLQYKKYLKQKRK